MIMRGLISGLIRRVSAEHQLRNTTFGLRKFIDSANILTAAWAAGHEPSKGQVAYFNKRKGLFCKDTLGGIGIDQLRRVLIEPELDAMDAHADARSAVISTCDWLKKQGCTLWPRTLERAGLPVSWIVKVRIAVSRRRSDWRRRARRTTEP